MNEIDQTINSTSTCFNTITFYKLQSTSRRIIWVVVDEISHFIRLFFISIGSHDVTQKKR
jgi:hypothetical protein